MGEARAFPAEAGAEHGGGQVIVRYHGVAFFFEGVSMSQLGAEWNRLANVLLEDSHKALAAYQCDSNNQFKRRTLIHFMFVAIEGVISIQKQMAHALYKKFGRVGLSQKQIDWLVGNNVRYFIDNLKLAFEVYRALLAVDFHLNLGVDPRWQSLRHLQDIRNRLTHPKHGDDMTVSDEEMDKAIQGFVWFAEQYQEFQERLHSQTEAIRTIIHATHRTETASQAKSAPRS